MAYTRGRVQVSPTATRTFRGDPEGTIVWGPVVDTGTGGAERRGDVPISQLTSEELLNLDKYGTTEGPIATEEPQRQAIARQQPQQFEGRVQEFRAGEREPVTERFFVRGRETGRIERTPEGKQVAVVTKPSRFRFEREEGVTEVTFGQEGAEIMNVELTTPELFEPEPTPTRGELIAAGGGIFYTGKEADVLGVTEGEVTPSAHQKLIYTAENILGIGKGTSKAVFIPEKSLDIKPVPRIKALPEIKSLVAGEKGKQFIGVGLPFRKPIVTLQEVESFTERHSYEISRISQTGLFKKPTKTQIETRAFAVRVGAAMIPTTPLDVSLYGAGGIITKAPKLIRAGVGGVVGVVGTKGALSTELTAEQRVASGIFGAAGTTGVIFEALPYVRGLKARISPKYRPIRTQPELFKAVEMRKVIKLEGYTGKGKIASSLEIKELPIKVDAKIGLIPPGYSSRTGATAQVKLPSVSPLVRGGFHRKAGGERMFLGKGQWLATSQRGLFKKGLKIPLEKPFFVTPQEPFLKIPETRVSRLALGGSLFEIPKSAEIGFGPPAKPQIGLTISGVGRVETPRQFRLGTGTELEAVKTFGTIKDIQKLGVTTIKGEGVNIYSFAIGRGQKKTKLMKDLTTLPTTKVSGEVALGLGGLRTMKTTTKIPSYSIPTTKLTTMMSSKTLPTKPLTTSMTTRTLTPSIPTTIKTPIISPPVTIKTPTIIPPTIPIIPKTPPRPPPTKPIKFFFGPTKLPRAKPQFRVLERRFGKFKPVGTAPTIPKAIFMGKQRVSRTLGATFKIERIGKGPLRLPTKIKGYRTKFTPLGLEYIQPRGKRLAKMPEIKEIQYWKKMKGGII